MRVLVVSENPAERARAASMLRVRDEVEVVETASATEAKQLVADGGLDVLVVDGNLSPQGGYSFLYEMQQAAELAGTVRLPALLLTTRDQDQWLAGWAAADATLPLPADPFAVARAVDALVAPTPV